MADCEHLARTSAYFDGALPEADEAEATEHLASCAVCQGYLRDAVTLDAVTAPATAPAAPITAGARRWSRRRAVGVAGASLAAIAAIAAAWVIVVRPPQGPVAPAPEVVAVALPRERALEARFTGARFAPHRPYAPLRGDQAREAIAIRDLAELERRGDVADLVAALAATGDLGRAGEVAATLGHTPEADSDRAAVALTAGDSEAALAHAYRALDRAPALAAAWWNLGLAARAQGLPRVSRAAFAAVVERAEPGWADEARRQLAALDRELAPTAEEHAAFTARGRAMVAGGALITVDDVRRFPTWARIHVLDAIRARAGAELGALAPLAAELDRASGAPTVAAALRRAQAADPKLRAPLAERYRAVVARTATPADIDALLAQLRAAGPALDDLRVGTLILSGRAAQRIDELRAAVSPWRDPWFDLLVVREELRARWPRDDVRAEPPLAAASERCTEAAWALRCGQLAYDLAERLSVAGRDQDAERWARRAADRYRAAGSAQHLYTALSLLADVHRNLTRAGLARAEFDEVVRGVGDTSCDLRRFARIGQAALAVFAGDWAAARAALPAAHPEEGCADQPDRIGIAAAVDLARHSGLAGDLAVARAWLAEGQALAAGGLSVIGALRLARGTDAAATEAARAWIAAHRADRDQPVAMARVWGTTALMSDAGARGDWTGALDAALADHGAAITQPCVVAAVFDDDNVTIAARPGVDRPVVGARQATSAPELGQLPIVPPSIAQALVGCPAIAVIARPPLHGRSDLLPAGLPWAFVGDEPAHAGGRAPARTVDVSDARPPVPELARLSASGPDDRFDVALTGADATPARVLAALADATYAELHVHGVATAANADATYLALSPDRDGRFALRADAVRAAKLTAAPTVVLAACRASTVAPYLHQRWSLPDAFLAAGASAVVAADVAIPDAAARRVFGELRRRLAAGEPVEAAVAALRAAATGDAAWATHLMVFR